MSASKGFTREISLLTNTYLWAKEARIDQLTSALAGLRDLPITCVGSGGSLSIAAFCSMLHEFYLGRLGIFSTPLEVLLSPDIRGRAVILVSAEGRNPDIVQVCRHLAKREPAAILGLVLSSKSKLSNVLSNYPWTSLAEFSPPFKKDGFLATNSLVAGCVLLHRAYSRICGLEETLPEDLPRSKLHVTTNNVVSAAMQEALRRPTLVVLYAGWAKPAAIDVESKLTEAGLTNVQLADFRNFGHGRHYWLSRNSKSTAVVSLTLPATCNISKQTLDLLPKDLPILELAAAHDNSVGAIELLTGVLKLTELVAIAKSTDPGRPNVPVFGRKLYHLGINGSGLMDSVQCQDAFLRRKLGDVLTRWPWKVVEATRTSLVEYLHVLAGTRFRAVVFDYDGTLCPPSHRFSALPEKIVEEINRLLKGGIIIGIATGRGKSVRDALKTSFAKEFWNQVIIGYYNGAEIFSLDGSLPNRDGPTEPVLAGLAKLISRHPQLSKLCKLEHRPRQLSLIPVTNVSVDLVHYLTLEVVNSKRDKSLSVVRSAHSIDIIGSSTSKMLVLDVVASLVNSDSENEPILCVADSGTWAGNDLQLLSTRFSLSVDAAPVSASAGWNIAPLGHKGVQATLDYLRAMRAKDGFLKIDIKRLV